MKSTNSRPQRPHRERILVVTHADNWLEIFAGPNVLVHCASMLATGPEGELAAEQILEAQLPRPYRELYEPGNRRYAGLALPRTPADELARLADMRAFAALTAFGEALQAPEVASWVA